MRIVRNNQIYTKFFVDFGIQIRSQQRKFLVIILVNKEINIFYALIFPCFKAVYPLVQTVVIGVLIGGIVADKRTGGC